MSSNNVTFYINGVNKGTVNHTAGGNANSDDSFRIGTGTNDGSNTLSGQFHGLIDEVKISNTPRSPGWLVTEYNNQNSPSTFMTLGEVACGSSFTNTWNYQNRLTQTVAGSTTVIYDYYHTGQRARLYNGTANTHYPSKYYNAQGATETRHIFSPTGELLATVIGTTVSYVHGDQLGSSSVVSDSTGATVQLVDYYPYGAKRLSEGTDVSQREYIGEQFDEDTGLNYRNARYYDSSRGQFISQDPVFLAMGNAQQIKQLANLEIWELLSDPQSLNSYACARNNPLAFIDPDGNMWTPWQSRGVSGCGVRRNTKKCRHLFHLVKGLWNLMWYT